MGSTRIKMKIVKDDLSTAPIINLLQEHYQEMLTHSPEESVHALDIEGMKQANLTFWSGWLGGEIAGCGALKELSSKHGEIKSMRTAKAFLRQGIAAKLLQHIIDHAKVRGYNRLSLETGTPEAFEPARALYKRFGFVECQPFGDYIEDPYSIFYTLELG